MSSDMSISFTAGGAVSDGPYPVEQLPEEDDWEREYGADNGTMPASKQALAEAVVGHKIVAVGKLDDSESYGDEAGVIITLDNGTRALVRGIGDCCAITEVTEFLLHADKIDHIITGVGTTDGYTRWHIFADFGDVLELTVNWSCGNPFYYGYGFDITVEEV